jgi:CubicO group peptidase (beta-lactamase class C family)
MRYRPARFDGKPDAETAAILDALTAAPAEARPAFDRAALDRELRSIATDPEAPLASLSVVAIRAGQVVYDAQFGHRFIAAAHPSASLPADARTLYRVASISKLVTTLGALRLVEAGRLDLDADVSSYLGYRLRNPRFPDPPITTRMLLTHTSSLRDDAFYFWPAKHALKDVLVPGGALHGDGSMWAHDAPPGAHFRYANLNWGVLGTVLERVTGERFDRLMSRLVLEPLGLRGGFNPAEFSAEELRDMATLYCKCRAVDGKEVWSSSGRWIARVDDYSVSAPDQRADAWYEPGRNGTVFGPQGNLRISAADLAKAMLMLMNPGEHDGLRFLKPETLDMMFSRQWEYRNGAPNGKTDYGTRRSRFNAWGLGAQVFVGVSGPGAGDRLVRGDFDAVGHLGDAYGFSGIFAFDRRRKDGMVVLIGGTGFDPEGAPGAYSSLARHEERILSLLHEHAIARP